MPELEKVIAGLESCRPGRTCEKCPYHDLFDKGICNKQLEADALALLKAQMPRVMTLEEAREALHNSDFIVIENAKDIDLLLGMRTSEEWEVSSGAYLEFDDMDDNARSGDYYVRHYNKDFRFWTSRPSQQQRYSTPWGGDVE